MRLGYSCLDSRFDDDLKRIGLIADWPHVRSDLESGAPDPGVDMTIGSRPPSDGGKSSRLCAWWQRR